MASMKKQKKTQPAGKNKTSIASAKRAPAKPTRDKILEAAIKVFADYPYYAASIRMIGKAAEIDHPLINYYFPTKAELFEEIVKITTEEYYQSNITWFEGLENLSPAKGLSLYIDRFFDFALKRPKTLRIIALNLVQAGESEIIPGYERLLNFFSETMQTFVRAVPLKGTKEDVKMLTTNFNTMVINYLGASDYYAGILGMEPRSPEYLKWVKNSLISMILPQFKQLLEGVKI
jgi:AcrR family transcriptional regulator